MIIQQTRQPIKRPVMTILKQLRELGGVVADSSDLSSFQQYAPLSGITTNPTLILKGIAKNAFPDLVIEAVKRAKESTEDTAQQLQLSQSWLLVLVANRLSEYVDGRVSIEVDARLAYDEEKTFQRACELIEIAQSIHLGADKLLIKIAATWQGIKAANRLEAKGINCNMTLLFDFYQAIACAQAKATLISPFVGRITDWYKKHKAVDYLAPEEDPGIESVKRIYCYYKANNIDTVVMAASFRSTEQIEHLSGCDLLTISPDLLDQLNDIDRPLAGSIKDYEAKEEQDYSKQIDEESFHKHINDNPMAKEKLQQGVEQFVLDQEDLEKKLQAVFNS